MNGNGRKKGFEVSRTLSLWSAVPDSTHLQRQLSLARDPGASFQERQRALEYLSGATKVLASLEKRAALADYLDAQIRKIKSKLHS